jgi:3-phosphoshikimate 1-carboxyvinyltransferase
MADHPGSPGASADPGDLGDPDNPGAAELLPQLPRPPKAVHVAPRRRAEAGAPRRSPSASLRLPGSKYYTLRYLLDALLADGESQVHFPALSDDTAVLVGALRALGAAAEWERDRGDAGDRADWSLRVRGTSGRLQTPRGGVIQAGNAGAVLRLLLGIGALLPEVRFETDHPDSLGRRPNAELLAALRSLGIQTETRGPEGLLPITLRGGPPQGGAVSIACERSSQYLSALLYLAPLLPQGMDITVAGALRSAPLVRATLRALAAASITCTAATNLLHFSVPGGQRYRAGDYAVPGDGPSAAALACAALLLDVPLQLDRLSAAEEDVGALVEALAALGADLAARHDVQAGETLALRAGSPLHGASIDGDACIDSVPVLVALACFAEGETRFANVATLRLKESDRIDDLCAELARAGCTLEALPDGIVVHGMPGGIPGGATVWGHDDHRLVQALALAALRSREGLTITGAEAVAKSYPTFFDDLAALGAQVAVVEA